MIGSRACNKQVFFLFPSFFLKFHFLPVVLSLFPSLSPFHYPQRERAYRQSAGPSSFPIFPSSLSVFPPAAPALTTTPPFGSLTGSSRQPHLVLDEWELSSLLSVNVFSVLSSEEDVEGCVHV